MAEENPRCMQVVVIFEFENVEPDTPKEDEIINSMIEETERMRVAFDANDCWVDNAYFLKIEGSIQ
jgi:hypothetical protein